MASSTYSFSSQPKPVAGTRKKYRDPGDDLAPFRDLKETCITWDKRVHRGNTYSMHVQNALRAALEGSSSLSLQESQLLATGAAERKRRRSSRPKEPKIFDLPLPEPDRVPVDLTKHLTAPVVTVQVDVCEAQTDEFLPEEPPDMYMPQKTGIDCSTQVEDGELFNFDYEVEPILEVVVWKTMEQALAEVEEEHELEAMRQFKEDFYKRQARVMHEWKAQVDEEWARWHAKEKILELKREEKRREARVLLKIQAANAAKRHLAGLVPNAVRDLQEVAFPDMRGMAINRDFLPQLFQQVRKEVQATQNARQLADELLAPRVQRLTEGQARGLAAHAERARELERRHLERLQIRRGKIRVRVDLGGGAQVSVGPIQISKADSVEEAQARVWQWLQENEPELAQSWPHGVLLCVRGEPVQATAELFEAEAGQTSLVPSGPPEAETADGEEADGGDEEDGEEEG